MDLETIRTLAATPPPSPSPLGFRNSEDARAFIAKEEARLGLAPSHTSFNLMKLNKRVADLRSLAASASTLPNAAPAEIVSAHGHASAIAIAGREAMIEYAKILDPQSRMEYYEANRRQIDAAFREGLIKAPVSAEQMRVAKVRAAGRGGKSAIVAKYWATPAGRRQAFYENHASEIDAAYRA